MDRSLVYNQFIFSKHISTFKLSTRPISPLSHSIILRNYFSPWLTPWIAANGKDRLLGACSNTSTLKFHINLQKKTVRGGTKQKVKGKIRGQSVFCCSSEGDTRIFEFKQRAFNSYAFSRGCVMSISMFMQDFLINFRVEVLLFRNSLLERPHFFDQDKSWTDNSILSSYL